MDNIDPYKILQVDKNFTIDILKQKYKQLAIKLHPDKGGDNEKVYFN